MLNRERVIYVGVLLLVFAGIFAVHRFYFSAKLEKYAQHQQLLEAMRKAESNLKSTFGNAQPDDVIRDHSGKVEAWNEAIAQREPFFTDKDWREHETPPQDVFILQFWYGDTSQKMVEELWEKAQKKYGPQLYERMPAGFPTNVQSMLGVAKAESWQGLNIEAKLVNGQLERLRYGISAFELLMDNNALKINELAIEELGSSGFLGKDAYYTRLRMSFMMEAKDLVSFLDGLRMKDTYYSVEGMRVTHPYVLARYEPQLNVDMFLLRTRSEEGESAEKPVVSAAEGYAGKFGSPALALGGAGSDNAAAAEGTEVGEDGAAPEPGRVAKAWKWFKRNVLVMN